MAQPQKTTISKPFRFLDLPPEIRERIYILICHDPENPISLNDIYHKPEWAKYHPSNPSDFYPHDLLLVNSQIYHETRPLFFNTNTFQLSLIHYQEYIFNGPSFRDNSLEIHSLIIVIHRWYLAHELFALLEEMILRGKLRTLEVLLRDVAIRKLEEEGNGLEQMELKCLMKICRDPVLKKVSIRGVYEPWKDYTHLVKWGGLWGMLFWTSVFKTRSNLLDKKSTSSFHPTTLKRPQLPQKHLEVSLNSSCLVLPLFQLSRLILG